MARRPSLVIALVVVVVLTTSPAVATPEVTVGPAPAWLAAAEPDLAPSGREATRAGGHLLLLDAQRDTRRGEASYRQVARVTNADGVATFSDVVVTFDPAYESLTFHHVRVLRDGEMLDRLSLDAIGVYQRERGLEFGFYDGEATAVINVVDVRVGDVVDFAYTVHGAHPLLNDHVVAGYYQNASAPVRDMRLRLVTPADTQLNQFPQNGAEPLRRVRRADRCEYTWRGRDVAAATVDANVPPGWEYRARVTLTSFADWAAVAAWARPLYRLNAGDRAELAAMTDDLLTGDTREDRILAAIRFVQDEVRYLAREHGIWGFQPRRPAQCLGQRHGDCKDKSLLLTALLEQLGVEAYPVLVSLRSRARLAEQPPAPSSFDHCVVGFEWAGRRRLVDPTRDHQGGGLDGTAFPALALGLPVRDGADALIALPEPVVPRIEIREVYDVHANGAGDADYAVETRYHGAEADDVRASLAGASLEEVGRQYLQFYSTMFPGIEQAAPVAVIDADREGENVVVVRERYRIREAWQADGGGDGLPCFEFYPLEFNSHVIMASSPARTAPYWAGPPIDLRLTSEVRMPEDWPVALAPVAIAGDGYAFEHRVDSDGPVVYAEYRYERTREEVPAAEAAAFIAAHDEILEQLGLFLYDTGSTAGAPSPLAVTLFVMALLTGGVLAVVAARRYDPEPRADVERPRRFGGWLLLPAIGFAVAPLVRIGELFITLEMFDRASWELMDTPQRTLIAGELIVNALLIALTVLLAWLFFRKRTSAPPVAVVTLAATAVIVTADTVAAARYLTPELLHESVVDIVRSWVAAAIWVPYFLLSQRVRETFVARAEVRPVRPPTAPDVAAPG